MLKIEHTDIHGWEAAIRGMRNPMNSWDKSDTGWINENELEGCDFLDLDFDWCTAKIIGENDLKLMKNLSKAGNDHAKFLRYITVTADITAPLYWFKEYDTYKVATVANSCSTMHKIHEKEFTMEDFSFEHLTEGSLNSVARPIVSVLNNVREAYLNYEEWTKIDPDSWEDGINCKKDLWWQLIQLLPSSYNQKRTVQLNYQVLKQMYFARKNHKLDEWHTFCEWCESLPYFREICIQE